MLEATECEAHIIIYYYFFINYNSGLKGSIHLDIK